MNSFDSVFKNGCMEQVDGMMRCKENITIEEMATLPFYLRRAFLIEEANRKLRKNKETDDFDYLDLHGINKVLLHLKLKYLITDEPITETLQNSQKNDLQRPGLKIIDMVTGQEMLQVFVPWPEHDDRYDMSKVQMIGANITYLRRYLIMWAYDLSSGDVLDKKLGGIQIPEVEVNPEMASMAPDLPEPLRMQTTTSTEEEFYLDPIQEQQSQNNIIEDAKNYVLTTGSYAGMCLGDLATANHDLIRNMAEDQGNPQLSMYCNVLLQQGI